MTDGTEQSLQHCIEEINNFYMLSGLKINLEKTQIVWIRSKKYSNER